MGKIDQMKRAKIEKKIWEISPKNGGNNPKIQNRLNAQDLIIAQGGFFPKNNKRTQYLISMNKVDFFPQKQ